MDKNRRERLFKKLTPENWCQHDATADHIIQFKDGVTSKLNGDDWATAILEPELSATVPDDVQGLFEVGQGLLCYGCFFYPLYTLGSEQMYRVLEAAIRHKCSALGSPASTKNFAGKLRWLGERGVLSEFRLEQWHAARRLRNMSSHADRQSLYDPTMAVTNVTLVAELINELFEKTEGVVLQQE